MSAENIAAGWTEISIWGGGMGISPIAQKEIRKRPRQASAKPHDQKGQQTISRRSIGFM